MDQTDPRHPRPSRLPGHPDPLCHPQLKAVVLLPITTELRIAFIRKSCTLTWFASDSLPLPGTCSMLVYIDDSGDPGFKIGQGSTTHFTFALVCFDGDAEAEDARMRIDRLRHTLGFPARAEFKFNKSSRPVRERFLRALAPARFAVRSLVVDKVRLDNPRFRQGKTSFYENAIRVVMQHYQNELTGARVWLDGSAEKTYRLRLQRHVRRIGRVEEVRLVRSQSEPLIQMADMIAGAIRISHAAGRTDAGLYKALIAERIVEEWVIPA